MHGQPSGTGIPVERITGSVERVTFHSEESGFCVLRIKVTGKRGLVTVVGSAASLTFGEFMSRASPHLPAPMKLSALTDLTEQ